MSEQETMTKAEREFLDELTQLSRYYGVTIGGCGCCGSPFFGETDQAHSGAYIVGTGSSDLEFMTEYDIRDEIERLSDRDDPYSVEQRGRYEAALAAVVALNESDRRSA